MGRPVAHSLFHYSRHNPRYSVAAFVPRRNLREGLRGLRSFVSARLESGWVRLALAVAVWALNNLCWEIAKQFVGLVV